MIKAYVLAIGAVIGSFLNVLIYRLPKNEGFVTGRSHCPHCGKLIKWYENIPIISFAVLRGKCSGCQARISWLYPFVELITALSFLTAYILYGLTFQAAIVSLFFALLLVVTVIDFQHYIIPDKITIPGMILGLASSFVNPTNPPLSSLLGLLAGGVSLFLLATLGDFLFKKESLGGGDIKLAAMLGAFLGWKNIILIFFASAVLGLIYAVIQMAISEKVRKSRMIPFGPFLSLAGLIALFFGDYLINLYLERVLQIH
jgi:leader peptidase (prepilin peptidase)/N-methyltransferase